MTYELYRHFDANDGLLYVGLSLCAAARTGGHRFGSAWFGEVVKITIERYPDKLDAMAAELSAIRDEKPKFNRIVRSTTGPLTEAERTARWEAEARAPHYPPHGRKTRPIEEEPQR